MKQITGIYSCQFKSCSYQKLQKKNDSELFGSQILS